LNCCPGLLPFCAPCPLRLKILLLYEKLGTKTMIFEEFQATIPKKPAKIVFFVPKNRQVSCFF
jgi:hypothetical protein